MVVCKKCGYELDFSYTMEGGASCFVKTKGTKLFKFVSQDKWKCPMCKAVYTPNLNGSDRDYIHTNRYKK